MKIFFAFARQAFHTTTIYTFDFWLRVFNTFVLMYASYWMWHVLYTQDGGANAGAFGVSLEQMVTYGVLGVVMSIATRPGNWITYVIAQQVKTGAIEMELLKPLDFHLHQFARNAGEMIFYTVTLGLPSYLIGVLFLGVQPPANLLTGLLFLISMLLGYAVLFSYNFLIGLLSIFTIDIRSIGWALNVVIRFFSGAVVPLWLFPLFLAQVADVLPFKHIFATPLSIYIGKLLPLEMAGALLFQVGWLLVLAWIGQWGWKKAQSRIVVQGG